MKKIHRIFCLALALLFVLITPAQAFEELSKGSKGDAVVELQNKLNELGYSVGTADGDFGVKTEQAIQQFQKDHNLPVTGIADAQTQEVLFGETDPEKSKMTNDSVAIEEGYDPELFSETGDVESAIIKSITSPDGPASVLLSDGNSENVSLVAALLEMEMMSLGSKYFTFSYYDPVYVCKHSEDLVSAAFKFQAINRYVLVYFQREPLAISYGVLRENDMSKIKEVLEANNETVWEISGEDYKSTLLSVGHQFGYI